MKSVLNLFRFALSDAWRYYRHASGFGATRQAHRLAGIAIGAHVLERGLALPNPRPLFGREEIAHMDTKIRAYLADGGNPHVPELRAALAAMRVYLEWHGQRNDPPLVTVWALTSHLENHGVTACNGGVETMNREDLKSRHSIRVYDPSPVAPAVALEAVRFAQSAPSVCNRQSGRVHLFLGNATAARVLGVHVGSGGMREAVPAVAVITSDLRTFGGVKERYQAWIDGGLFLMQFLNGLHAAGLGGCPLNWSVYPDRDNALRREAKIPDHERIIALVAFGNLPDRVRFAKSPRLPVETIVTITAP